MPCDPCVSGLCLRRGVALPEGARAICHARRSAADVLDREYGIVNPEVIPWSMRPENPAPEEDGSPMSFVWPVEMPQGTPPASKSGESRGCCGPGSPSLLDSAWNLAGSLVAFVADGLSLVSPTAYQQRLEVCSTCARRQGAVCRECGCLIALKARGRVFDCPLGKWPAVGD